MLCEHGSVSPCVECDIEPLRAEIEKLREKMNAMVEALEWYSEQVLGCRKITSEGDRSRIALDRDGGARARAALETHRKGSGV